MTDPTLTWEDDGGPCAPDDGVVADRGAPSTVTGLIEALARTIWEHRVPDMAWDMVPDHYQHEYRVQAWGVLPVVVEFVADWIVDRPGLLPVQPEGLASAWRKEMTDA